MSDAHEAVKAVQLSVIEARILGCLVEKEATTPDVYPLTTNSIVQACNQKTSRDPVMELEPGNVAHALRQMEISGLVRSQHTSRSERYEHRLDRVLGLTRKQLVLIALLMLRGPQTVHELLARSERLAKFENAEDVQHGLERLMQKTPSLIVALPRASGQRGERYMHTLCGEVDLSQYAADEPGSSSIAQAPGLLARIESLEARVAALEARLGMQGDAEP